MVVFAEEPSLQQADEVSSQLAFWLDESCLPDLFEAHDSVVVELKQDRHHKTCDLNLVVSAEVGCQVGLAKVHVPPQ